MHDSLSSRIFFVTPSSPIGITATRDVVARSCCPADVETTMMKHNHIAYLIVARACNPPLI
jgi:hypothetical protein